MLQFEPVLHCRFRSTDKALISHRHGLLFFGKPKFIALPIVKSEFHVLWKAARGGESFTVRQRKMHNKMPNRFGCKTVSDVYLAVAHNSWTMSYGPHCSFGGIAFWQNRLNRIHSMKFGFSFSVKPDLLKNTQWNQTAIRSFWLFSDFHLQFWNALLIVGQGLIKIDQ